ncbi:DinB family protein [Mucilaginibacter sp. AW1-3]
MEDQTALFVKMALDAWNVQNKRFNDLVNKLSDEQLLAETAAGRNTGIYLLGHLIAVNDALLPTLGFGQRFYPEFEAVFLRNPDKSGLPKPGIAELKAASAKIDAELNAHIAKMQPADWFAKHTAVSAEDFAKEPHRNKLNVLLNRTTHMGYHLGQMAYLAAHTAS